MQHLLSVVSGVRMHNLARCRVLFEHESAIVAAQDLLRPPTRILVIIRNACKLILTLNASHIENFSTPFGAGTIP
jgi:hypothetical protein